MGYRILIDIESVAEFRGIVLEFDPDVSWEGSASSYKNFSACKFPIACGIVPVRALGKTVSPCRFPIVCRIVQVGALDKKLSAWRFPIASGIVPVRAFVEYGVVAAPTI